MTSMGRVTSGLRGRLTRLLHWDLTVRDLDTSIAFYEALTPFRATDPVDDGVGRSALLDVPGRRLPRLRLTQWHDGAVGAPHDVIGALGFTRVVLHVADLDATRARAEALGFPPVAPTTGDDFRFDVGSRGSVAYTVWTCLDPDGIVVEFLRSGEPKVSTVAQGTADLERSLAFHTDVLGLDLVDTVATPGPVPNVYLPGGAPVEFRGVFLRVPGVEAGYLDVLEHRDPAARRAPYATERQVGVVRGVLGVDDVDAAAELLRATPGVGASVEGPREVRFGADLGTRRMLEVRDPDGAILGLAEDGPGVRPTGA